MVFSSIHIWSFIHELCVDIIQDSVFSQLNFTIRDNTVPGGVPGGGGDLGRWVRGDADVLRWLAIVSVHGDIAAPLLRVGPHLSMIIMVIGNG